MAKGDRLVILSREEENIFRVMKMYPGLKIFEIAGGGDHLLYVLNNTHIDREGVMGLLEMGVIEEVGSGAGQIIYGLSEYGKSLGKQI